MKRILLIIISMFMPLAAMSGEGSGFLIGKQIPDFTLEDQYDRTCAARQWEGRTVIIIAADKDGSEQNPPWKKAIAERYGDRITVQGVADLRAVPFFLKSRIRKDFQKEKAGILLDWDGIVFASCGLVKNVSNIVLIDKKGMVRHIHSGPAAPDAVARLFNEADKLVK